MQNLPDDQTLTLNHTDDQKHDHHGDHIHRHDHQHDHADDQRLAHPWEVELCAPTQIIPAQTGHCLPAIHHCALPTSYTLLSIHCYTPLCSVYQLYTTVLWHYIDIYCLDRTTFVVIHHPTSNTALYSGSTIPSVILRYTLPYTG